MISTHRQHFRNFGTCKLQSGFFFSLPPSPSAFCRKSKRLFRRPMEVILAATPQRGKTPFGLPPPAGSTVRLVTSRSSLTSPAVLTQEWALERWSSTLLIPIPQLALQRCYSILPARRTRPLELTRSYITLLATAIPPSVPRRSSLMTAFPATTRHLALRRSSLTLMAIQTPPAVKGQDKTPLRAPITRTSATWLVPSPPTKAIRSASATSQTGTGRYSVSSVVSTTTSNLLAAWLFKLLWILRTTTLAGILARARVVAHLCNAAHRNVVARPARQLSAQPCSMAKLAKLRSWKRRSLGNKSK